MDIKPTRIEACPFCRGRCVDISPISGSTTIFYPYVQCVVCQYCSPARGTAAEAIESHNAVAGKVREAEARELEATSERRDWARVEMTRDPIFILERHTGRNRWVPERVFLSRGAGEAWGEAHKHWFTNHTHDSNPPKGWRVYCVPASGALADLLGRTEKRNMDD